MKTKSAATAAYIKAARVLLKACQRFELLQYEINIAEGLYNKAYLDCLNAKTAAFANKPDLHAINHTVMNMEWQKRIRKSVKL